MLTRQASDKRVCGMRLSRRRMQRWTLAVPGAVLLLLLLAVAVAYTLTDTHYLARVLLWREADVGDYGRFPARLVRTAPPRFEYLKGADSPISDPRLQSVMVEGDAGREERNFSKVLESTGTTAFLVIHEDRLVYERYLNGYDRDSTQTSFSMAKSYVSALVGIAIQDGHIEGVDDPVTRYIPELARRDPRFERITIGHLLSMRSGIRYRETGTPWGDDARTYYEPDLRRLALERMEIEGAPGGRFLYNNYHPLLVGLVLERATGVPAAQYLEEKLWRPLGTEADGSWSLDSKVSGFEKMESGINGRATDFAKFGSLYLHEGEWRGRQLVPREWVRESTRAHTATDRDAGYGYFWWVGDGGEYWARGNYGQFIYVSPDKDLVMVRFGTRFGLETGGDGWVEIIGQLAERFD